MNFLPVHSLEASVAAMAGKAGGANRLAVLRQPGLATVLTRGIAPDPVTSLSGMGQVSLRKSGPDQWLAVAPELPGPLLVEALAAALGDAAHIVDQSDGTVLMRIEGPAVRRILAKCVAVDLHADVFAVGHGAAMMCCHVSVHLSRVGDDAFDIAVPRSYAPYVFDEIVEMGREFALGAGFEAM